MDYNLLSQLLRELILDNDRVSLPEMGSFIADIAPAYFSEDGKTINPPFRRIFFRSTEMWNDELIEKYYAEKLGVERETISAEIEEFFEKFRLDLNVKKNIELPGLGKMRSTKEGNIYFTADRGLDIYANAYGLEPISLKVLVNPVPDKKKKKVAKEMESDNIISEEEMSDIVSDMTVSDAAAEREYLEDYKRKEEEVRIAQQENEEPSSDVHTPESEPEQDITPSEANPAPEPDEVPTEQETPDVVIPEPVPSPVNPPVRPVAKPVTTPKKETSGKALLVIIYIVIGIILIGTVIFILLITGMLDSLLYTPEELQLINGSGL